MDKLLLSLPFIVLLTSLTVNSAPMPSSKIISSIQQQQQQQQRQKYEDDDSMKIENAESTMKQYKNSKLTDRLEKYLYRKNIEEKSDDESGDDYFGEVLSQRQNKMIGFYPGGYNPYAYPLVVPYPFYPPEFYDDFSSYYGFNDDDEIMSRTAGNRKRPGNFKNSPIYYIRLPPTPYM